MLTPKRLMKKLSTANPELTFPERKAILEDFISVEHATADEEVSAFLESAGDEMEALVQQVRDEYCSDSIISWS